MSGMGRLTDSTAPLREPEFRKLFLGQATSIAGSMLTLVALPFAVLSIGGTATDIGLVEAAYVLPMAIAVTVGGVWADRLDRRKVMLVVDLLRMVLTFAIAGLLLAELLTVPMLVLFQISLGLCDAFFRPAYTGLVPQVVSAAAPAAGERPAGPGPERVDHAGGGDRRTAGRRPRRGLGDRDRRPDLPRERLVPVAASSLRWACP